MYSNQQKRIFDVENDSHCGSITANKWAVNNVYCHFKFSFSYLWCCSWIFRCFSTHKNRKSFKYNLDFLNRKWNKKKTELRMMKKKKIGFFVFYIKWMKYVFNIQSFEHSDLNDPFVLALLMRLAAVLFLHFS